MKKPEPKRVNKHLQEALAAIETQSDLRNDIAATKTRQTKAHNELSRLLRKIHSLMDELGGYQNDPERYSVKIQDTERELESARAENSEAKETEAAALAAIERLQAALAATPAAVKLVDLRDHRASVQAAEAYLSHLTAHRERVQSDTAGTQPPELVAEHQDLLAARALGEDVGGRLSEVEAQLTSNAASIATNQAETAATLAGLSRKVEAAQAALDVLRDQERHLIGAYLLGEADTAAAHYEAMATQAAAALADLQALATLHNEVEPGTLGAVDVAGVPRAMLPRVRGEGEPLLSFKLDLAPGSQSQAGRLALLRGRFEQPAANGS